MTFYDQNPNMIFSNYLQRKPLYDALFQPPMFSTQAGAMNHVYRGTEYIAPPPAMHRCDFCGGMVSAAPTTCPNCGGPQ